MSGRRIVAILAAALATVGATAGGVDRKVVLVLFHGCHEGASSRDWMPLRDALPPGVTAVVPELPRIEAEGDNAVWMAAWRREGTAAVDEAFARARAASPGALVVAGGAGCGGFFALIGAERHPVDALFTLSGLSDEAQRLRLTSVKIPVLGIASADDGAVPGRVESIVRSGGPTSALKLFPGKAHGTAILRERPPSVREIVSWIVERAEAATDPTATPPLSEPPLPAGIGSSAPATRGRLTITAMANAGVMLSDGRSAVLIDALFRDGVEGYARLDAGRRKSLEKAIVPYDAVRLILVTHWHADHFDAGAVTSHLESNGRARAVVAAQVAATMTGAPRLESLTPDRGTISRIEVNGIQVEVVRLAHNPSRNFPEEHVGQAVRLAGRLVLHVGDADPTAANFRAAEPLAPVDVAIVPYWYLLSNSGRAIVRDQLRARHVVAVHAEPEKAAEIEVEVVKAWPGARVFVRPGDRVEF